MAFVVIVVLLATAVTQIVGYSAVAENPRKGKPTKIKNAWCIGSTWGPVRRFR